jgi:hypothetical protein
MITLQVTPIQAIMLNQSIRQHIAVKLTMIRESREDGDFSYCNSLLAEIDELNLIVDVLSSNAASTTTGTQELICS